MISSTSNNTVCNSSKWLQKKQTSDCKKSASGFYDVALALYLHFLFWSEQTLQSYQPHQLSTVQTLDDILVITMTTER